MKIFSRVIIIVLLAAVISGLLFAFKAQEKEYNGIFVSISENKYVKRTWDGHIYKTGEKSEPGGMHAGVG